MRAIVATAWGGNEVFEERQVPRPEPGEGEVLVRVRAVGVNPVDQKTRQFGGLLKRRGVEPPVILGWDIAGTVEALGAGVTDLEVGEEVFGMPRFPDAAGGYAEYAAVPAADMAPMPANLDHVQAAALPLVGLTALQAFRKAELAEGQFVLVHAAAGGVGSVAVQIAKARGCRVAGTASTANRSLLEELGVDVPIDYTTQRFEDVLSDVDVVLDPIGGEVRERTWGVMRPGGILVSITAPPKEGEAEAHGVRATAMLVKADGRGMRDLGALAEAGALIPVVSRTLPLARVGEAHDLMEAGHGRGKVVLVV